jgi:ribosomal protein S18 acetylase RimI-like enzyme
MDYLIRKIAQNDLPALVLMCQKHAEYEQANYEPKGKETALKKAIFGKKSCLFCYIVEINQQIVGYTTYTFDFSTWDAQTFLYLDCLYLEPECRNKGIGEKLMALLTQIAVENNCVNVQWQTPVLNEKAIRFYKRVGGVSKEKIRFFIDVV